MKRRYRNILCTGIIALGAMLAPRYARAQDTSGGSMHSDSMSSNLSSKMPSKSYGVEIRDFAFGPMTLTVPVGATVTWTNKDEEPHTVYSNDDVFRSKALDTDEAFSFTFEKAGTYNYFCSVHPKMMATIIVGADKKPVATDQKMDGTPISKLN